MPRHPEHRAPHLTVVAHDSMDELHPALALRHLAEDMHPIGDPGIGDPGYGGMGSGDHLLERRPVFVHGAKPHLVGDPGLHEEIGDGMLERVRPRPVNTLRPVVVRDLLFEFLQSGVEVA